MTWARLDDRAITNIKLRTLSHPAFRVWALGLIYCASELTDGFVPTEALAMFPLRERELRKAVQELCAPQVRGKEPLWCSREHGYTVHDYLCWNSSREQVENRRRTAAERMARLRANGDANFASSSGVQSIPVHTIPDPTPAVSGDAPATAEKDRLPHDRLSHRYHELLATNLGIENPEMNWEKVQSIFKMALTKHEEAVIVNALEKFMADHDAYLVERAWMIGLFSPRFNRYLPHSAKADPPKRKVSPTATGVLDDWSDLDGKHKAAR